MSEEGAWAQTLADALDEMRVAETITELRREIDDLAGRLEGEEPDEADANRRLDGLACKVEAASECLAELVDLVEAQTERLETLEQQLGEAPTDDEAAVADWRQRLEVLERRLLAAGDGARAVAAPVEALRGNLGSVELRLDGLTQRLATLEGTLVELHKPAAPVAADKDLHLRHRRSPARAVCVLVAARQPGPRATLAFELVRAGYRATVAGSVEEIRRRRDSLGVDAALVGADLGERDARAALEALRSGAQGGELPVLLYADGPGIGGGHGPSRWTDAWGADGVIEDADPARVLAALAGRIRPAATQGA